MHPSKWLGLLTLLLLVDGLALSLLDEKILKKASLQSVAWCWPVVRPAALGCFDDLSVLSPILLPV